MEVLNTYLEDVKKIKEEFCLSDLSKVYTSNSYVEAVHDADVYKDSEKLSKLLNEPYGPMSRLVNSLIISMVKNEMISKRWSTKVENVYNWSHCKYKIEINCDANDIKSKDEVEELLRDCSLIIWESLKIIYSAVDALVDNIFFEILDYQFNFEYMYIDKFGNDEKSISKLHYEITRDSFIRTNKEKFPQMIKEDYKKMFAIGETFAEKGEFENKDLNLELSMLN